MDIQKILRVTITLGILAVAALLATMLWRHYLHSPWTRDGRIYADTINLTADVPGRVTQVLVKDNQEVKRGDLLFVIDPDRYKIALQMAVALVEQRKEDFDLKQRSAERRDSVGEDLISKDTRDNYTSAVKVAKTLYHEALAQEALAKLNLERTRVVATVDGYVTNLNIHVGDYAVVGKPVLALVDRNSFVVMGYFEETKVQGMKIGEEATIRLLDSKHVLKGHIVSFARAIYDRDNTNAPNLLANVTPTFSWVRLAQRIPVRIHFDEIPKDLWLSSGMTCTLILHPEKSKKYRALL